jgi:hypothetical protein
MGASTTVCCKLDCFENNEKCFGNLYVCYNLSLPNKFEDIHFEQNNKKEENIMDDTYIAYNCHFHELFKSD